MSKCGHEYVGSKAAKAINNITTILCDFMRGIFKRYPTTSLHGVTAQKTRTGTLIAVKTKKSRNLRRGSMHGMQTGDGQKTTTKQRVFRKELFEFMKYLKLR